MNICVIGAGYVGLVTGACFAEFGNHVTCVDKDEGKLQSLRSGEVPFFEPGLDELVSRNVEAGRLEFSGDLEAAVKDSLIVFVAVGTPRGSDGRADLSYIEEAAHQVGCCLDGYKLVVTKSTVPAGTGRKIRGIVEKASGGRSNFGVASNPEFLREGSAIEDFMRPNRIVIGAEEDAAIAILRDLYRPLFLIETPFVITDVVTAELIKYASNAFLATKISFINEMANLCEALGGDVHTVAKGMGLDGRIGSKFLHPGPGFGGSCLPKDTRALIQLAADAGESFKVVEAAVAVNEERIPRMIRKIEEAADGDLSERTVALLGLTFKPNTDDLRESPALAILEALIETGANLRVYDPVVMDAVRKRNLSRVTFCDDEYDAAAGADVLAIATEWNQFRGLHWDRLRETMRFAAVADLRNVYNPEPMRAAGFRYVSVGRK